MPRSGQHQAAFVALWVSSVVIGWHLLVSTFALALQNDEYTYIFMIFPISVTLICREWRTLESRISFDGVGLVLLALAIVAGFGPLHAAAFAPDMRLSVGMFALVLCWIASFVLCFGRRAAWSVLFALLFLFALIPLPQQLLSSLITQLQWGSAWTAHGLFVLFRVPVTQQGILLTIPGLTVEVAQECSSIRSSSILLVTAIVLAQWLLRSPSRRALVVALSVPLSIAKNGLRIFAIAMLGTHVDPAFLTGNLHRHGGIVFFVIALLVIFALLSLLKKSEHPSPASDAKLASANSTAG